eukprot:7513886-Alexandrium_andersonii.AAC.1
MGHRRPAERPPECGTILQPGRPRVLAQGRLLVACGRVRGVEPSRREKARGEEAPTQQHAQ